MKCIVCFDNVEEEDDSTEGISKINPEVFENYCRSLNAKSKPMYQWSWNTKMDSPIFCTVCTNQAFYLDNTQTQYLRLQQTFSEVLSKVKNVLLMSLSKCEGKLNFCKAVLQGEKKFESITVLDKIDFFRSIAALDFNPAIVVRGCTYPVPPPPKYYFPFPREKKLFSFIPKKLPLLNRRVISKNSVSSKIFKGEIIDLKTNVPIGFGLPAEEEVYYFPDGAAVDGSYTCRICNISLKKKQYAFCHVYRVHKCLTRYKCIYCSRQFFELFKCQHHIINKHRKDRRHLISQKGVQKKKATLKITQLRCLQCYQICTNNPFRVSSDLFTIYKRCMNAKKIFYMFQWDWTSVKDIPSFCETCFPCVMHLVNLSEDLKRSQSIINDIVIKIKCTILTQMSEEKGKRRFYIVPPPPLHTITPCDKADYFRSLAIRGFDPDLILLKVVNVKHASTVKATNETNYETFTKSKNVKNERIPHQNSLFNLVQDEEILVIDPSAIGAILLLNEEEFENYLKCINDEFQCRVCGNILASMDSAVSHINKYHKGIKRYKCKYCEKQFYLRYDCAYHILKQHAERKMKSPDASSCITLCHSKRRTEDGIINLDVPPTPSLHIIRTKEGFKCAFCFMVHKQRSCASKHQKTVHFNIARFQCEFCSFKHLHRFSVKCHVKRCHADKLGEDANKGLHNSLKKSLAKRERNRNRVPIINPSEPIRLLELKMPLPNAEQDIKNIGTGYECVVCGRRYTFKLKIRRHIESYHYGIRKFECKICERKFYLLELCRKHIKCRHQISKHLGAQSSNEMSSESTNTNEQSIAGYDENNAGIMHESTVACNEPKVEVIEGFVDSPTEFLHDTLVNPNENNGWEVFEIPQTLFTFSAEHQHSELSLVEDIVKYEAKEEPSSDPLLTQSMGNGTSVQMPKSNRRKSKSPRENTSLIYSLLKEGDIVDLKVPPTTLDVIESYFTKVESGFKCQECAKTVVRGARRAHIEVVHLKLHNFGCTKCQMKFNTKFQCAEHFIVEHTKFNPYVCDVCQRKFKCNTTMRSHVAIHKEGKFPCSLCGLKLSTSSKLIKHVDIVHKSIA